MSRQVEPVLTEENGSCLKIKCEELTDKKVYRPLRMVCIVFFFSSVTELSELRPFMVGIFKDLGFPIKNHPISVSLPKIRYLFTSIKHVKNTENSLETELNEN